MINLDRLEEVLVLHNKTFALLRWVSGQMQHGALDLSQVHANMGVGQAAEQWLRRNHANLPTEVRPDQEELAAFASLFASYLRTSFEIGQVGRVSSCGCYCPFCSYLIHSPRLKARSLSKKARDDATALKRLYLEELLHDAGLTVSQPTLSELASIETPLARDVAMITYAKELIRRTEFVSQGEGVYALWREFAWSNGRSDRRFTLTTRAVEQSHKNVMAELKKRLA